MDGFGELLVEAIALTFVVACIIVAMVRFALFVAWCFHRAFQDPEQNQGVHPSPPREGELAEGLETFESQ